MTIEQEFSRLGKVAERAKTTKTLKFVLRRAKTLVNDYKKFKKDSSISNMISKEKEKLMSIVRRRQKELKR